MKRTVALLLSACLLLLPMTSFAEEFGPEEWNQYRLNSDKNAVFNSDESPLDFGQLQTAEQIRATPVVVGDKLFVGNHNSGDLFAFNLKSGEELWRNQAPNWIHSEMIYNNGKVFVGFGNRFFQDNGIRGTGESGVLALDAESGEIIWKFNTDGEVMPTPAYYNENLYISTGDRNLYKVDVETGELQKKVEIGSRVSMSSPNIYNDSLYVGGASPFKFYSYDLENDSVDWERSFENVVAGLDDVPPAIDSNIVVTTAVEGSYEDPNHMIYAMDTESGEVVWKDSLGKGDMVKNNKSGAPIIYKGTVFVGSPITKTFYAYDLESGEQLWELKDEVMKAPPVAQDGVVYFTNVKGIVNAVDTKSGELINSKELGGTLAPSGPIIVNDTIIVGSQDSNVYMLPISELVDESQLTEQSQEETTNEEKVEEKNNMNQIVMISAVVVLIIISLFIYLRVKK
ncbi:PQQ-binding-like beta-propeller repeat protein [Aquisalibacillus elongatus]|uniref:Outer membrane protein assembly factor BamB n=1 Tax=Aquisalibacillus elongatus TaxID=485577 RepID=A0A3N5B9X1_9BACI|nr:PQQ-binding-like beta-propeller repeat protein [Aquisalibacillus elongatus]RPF54177.1 outer membrane protein assembly factor BamB [Aquisalibacillus elongatus]